MTAKRALKDQVIELIKKLDVPKNMRSRVKEVCDKITEKTTVMDEQNEKIVSLLRGLFNLIMPTNARPGNPYGKLATARNQRLTEQFLRELAAKQKLEIEGKTYSRLPK